MLDSLGGVHFAIDERGDRAATPVGLSAPLRRLPTRKPHAHSCVAMTSGARVIGVAS